MIYSCFQIVQLPIVHYTLRWFSLITEAVSNEQETSATTSNYNEIMTAEQKRLHRLQVALQGVPPPPSVTIPQLDVTDILRLLKENRRLMISADAENEDSKELIGD
jgi:hypothetical protein